MFSSFDGVTVEGRDMRSGSQELDLVLFNDGLCPFFNRASSEIVVEAKNWEGPVGSPEVAWFLQKMRARRVTHGFFVCRDGITGECRKGTDGALDELYASLREGMRPVVLTLDELVGTERPDELIGLFKAKVCRMFVKKL
jgi:Restriction endonuclease